MKSSKMWYSRWSGGKRGVQGRGRGWVSLIDPADMSFGTSFILPALI